MPERLPIYELEADLLAAARTSRRLVLQAPTGSGKSTQVPQMLLRHGLLDPGQCVILQPRRLAARLLAARVAAELGVPLGREVGYQVRFESCVSDATRIRFETEGILLRQLLQNPSLDGVAAVIFDEFHERHLYADITLARALDLQEQHRPDLLVLVMSATLDADELLAYLAHMRVPKPEFQPALLRSEGRTFPVQIEYRPPRRGAHTARGSAPDTPPVWDAAAEAFAHYVREGGAGDVLIFMPGAFEISQTLAALRERPESRGWLLLPLHGELPPQEQDAAVARYHQPKVVVTTNVAETSITIEGVRLVIDSGLARIPRYDAARGINTLWIEPISQASADQRAGRAGRTAPGRCIRLWSEAEHRQRPERELPEVRRLDLAEVVLTLKAAGVEDLRAFRWLDPPDPVALARAEEELLDLGALRRDEPAGDAGSRPQPVASRTDTPEASQTSPAAACTRITPLGRKMLAFPVHPRYARMLLAAQEFGCVHAACLVAALTQGRDLLVRAAGQAARADRDELLGDRATSDFWILMRAWNYARQHQFRLESCRRLGIHAQAARQVGPLFEQFLRIARNEGLDVTPRETPDEALRKCILLGFSDRVARRLDEGTLRCELVRGRRGVLARESAVRASPLLVAAEIREVQTAAGEVQTILSLATAIEPAWLEELFPDEVRCETRVDFDPQARRVVAAEVHLFRDLAFAVRRVEPPADEAARVLAKEILAGRLPLPGWDHAVEQWLLRLRLLCERCPELQLPAFTEADRAHLVEQLCHGAISYKDIKERDVGALVREWLSPAQRALLDQHAPERVRLSNGRQPRVQYVEGRPPFIALRIQELYGVTETPRIALGRVPLVVQVLSPGMKPVQVTQDLAGFWRDHYPRLKSELQRRYPKHEWR
ncbi:MAG: ATP-dependent RNA helicase [Verrucomicrobiae bacterium]|nr:ATP-dependent RNA helicase [Verrucomicrobiae bacterium]